MLAIYMSYIEDEIGRNKFEKIYYKYRNLMYRVAHEVLKNVDDSEDAVQEAFTRISKNMHKVGEVNSSETKNFVCKITKNEAIRIYEKKQKRKESLETDLSIITDDGEQRFFDTYSKGEIDMINHTAVVLDKIPHKYKLILGLKYIHGYSGKEIAKLLDISETNVRQQLLVARKKLADVLKED